MLHELDFQKTFKAKIDKDILPSLQLGACNPQLAYKAYSQDDSVAVMLPCHVLIQAQNDTSTKVTFADPVKMFSFFAGKEADPVLTEVAHEANARLTKAFEAIQ